jgi:uncharacterized membrane protein
MPVPRQVLWAIGASMVVLAGVQYLGMRACLAIGAAIILGHNLLDPVWPTGAAADAPLWTVLHARHIYPAGMFSIYFSYPLLPWIGVGLLVAFILVRSLHTYGDPHQWHFDPHNVAATVMAFLATTKYPPSLLYVLMTLGVAAIVCGYADRLRGPPRQVLVTFGRAPLAFYVAHLYLLHTGAILLGVAQGFSAREFLTACRYFPKGYGVGLAGVYLFWIAIITTLHPLCHWMALLKSRRTDWWLSYV